MVFTFAIFSTEIELSEDTSFIQTLGQFRGGENFTSVSNENGNTLVISQTGYIHHFNMTSGANRGQIYLSTAPIGFTDIAISNNDNVLYSNLNFLGMATRGSATSGSTTTLVDTTKNFGNRGA